MTRSKKFDKDKVEVPSGTSPTSILDEVYEMYRRNHHFNLKLTQEKIYTMNLAEVQKFSMLVLEEALKIYDGQGKPRPHPNYFMAICRRLQKEGLEPKEKQNLGRVI